MTGTRLAGRRVLLRGAAAGIASGAVLHVAPVRSQELVTVGEQQIEIDKALEKLLQRPVPPMREGRVKIDVPQLADNGNSVSCKVRVDSPMTADDHVKAIHLILARNPRPWAISVFPARDAPAAWFETRIRLAASQRLMAVAVMNDDSFWNGAVDVVVSVSACVDGS